MTDPWTPPAALREALAGIASVPVLLVALDFDGTLAPLTARPEQARALPSSRAAVEDLLALPATPVAFVSGRAIASLRAAAQPPGQAILVGSHGLEYCWEAAADPDLALTAAERQQLEALVGVLEQVAASFPGAWVEGKPAGCALHTRDLEEGPAGEADARALAAVRSAFPGMPIREGKRVLEVAVRASNKGEALARLRDRTGADAVFYAGDDVTDEDGFAALTPAGDLGVHVGGGQTRAAFSVPSPEAISVVLAGLAGERAARLAGSRQSQ